MEGKEVTPSIFATTLSSELIAQTIILYSSTPASGKLAWEDKISLIFTMHIKTNIKNQTNQ